MNLVFYKTFYKNLIWGSQKERYLHFGFVERMRAIMQTGNDLVLFRHLSTTAFSKMVQSLTGIASDNTGENMDYLFN
jgi:hypothetical protein